MPVDRREFLRTTAGSAAATATATLGGRTALAAGRPAPHGPKLPGVRKSRLSTDEPPTPWDAVTSYNNFYEFAGSDDKDLPSELAPANLITQPWHVVVEGACERTGRFPLEELLDGHALEERTYRHGAWRDGRWSSPGSGFPCRASSSAAPTANARFLSFDSHYDSARMPRSRRLPFDWPYTEGLRMDEARHPLAILAVGLYGEALPPQNGAPIRLVVPWKYGFKSIKSIVRVRFLEDQPVGTYQQVEPRSYGFYANVNPAVDHPLWSQRTERRIGDFFRRDTLLFNGYGDQVAPLYAAMDLTKNY